MKTNDGVNFSTNLLAVGIIGGGCAGMSCALWLKHLGYQPIIIETQAQLGGQLRQLKRLNRWVLGSPDKTSQELAEDYTRHIIQEAIAVQYGSQLIAVEATSGGFNLTVTDSNQISTAIAVKALVIATGISAQGTAVFSHLAGFQRLIGAGLLLGFPLDHLDKLPALRGKTVAVVGGGDNAHFTAKDIALAGGYVHLLIRSSPKASLPIRHEVEALIHQGNIIEHLDTQVIAFEQNQKGIKLILKSGNVVDTIQVDMIFARTGFTANTEFLDKFSAFAALKKSSSYLLTDAVNRTSIPWLYAIGDVASPQHQSVVNAIADGAIAAKDLSERK